MKQHQTTPTQFSGMVTVFEKVTNSELLATKELELPTSGDSTCPNDMNPSHTEIFRKKS